MSRYLRLIIPLLIIVVLLVVAQTVLRGKNSNAVKVDYGGSGQSFLSQLNSGKVSAVLINTSAQTVQVTPTSGPTYTSGYPDSTLLAQQLAAHPGVIVAATSSSGSAWTSLLTLLLPVILIVGFMMFMLRRMQGAGSQVMSFGKSRAKRVSVDSPKVTFKDVAGADEAVEELHEIKEFLENPKKFQQLGARIPKGVLLFGPPGTGKTLLARAVAGEAGVPFFSISGSDFVEMFVGVGASRVRDLFEQAKQNAPLHHLRRRDRRRRSPPRGRPGRWPRRARADLEPAARRDGRLRDEGQHHPDRGHQPARHPGPGPLAPRALRPPDHGRPPRPPRPQGDPRGAQPRQADQQGDRPRHAGRANPGLHRRRPRQPGERGRPLAARYGKKVIDMHELEEGIMRVLAGPEKKTRIISEKEKAITAYHEMGHALVGHFLEYTDPVHKISVVSRGQALGFTISLPTEDKFLTTKGELMDTLAMTLGGRAAEEVVFGEITTGAANDLEKATATAKQMIMRYGMSEELGPRTLGHDQSMPFLGREFQQQADYSDEVARQIDDEIRRIIEDAHQRARDLLTEKREMLDRISHILMERETIEASEFQALVDGVAAEEVFRERDAKAARGREKAARDRDKRPTQSPVPKPAHVTPMTSETS